MRKPPGANPSSRKCPLSSARVSAVGWSAAADPVAKIRAALAGPGGLLEQEDSDSWAQQFVGSSIRAVDDLPYYYGLGAGDEAVEELEENMEV